MHPRFSLIFAALCDTAIVHLIYLHVNSTFVHFFYCYPFYPNIFVHFFTSYCISRCTIEQKIVEPWQPNCTNYIKSHQGIYDMLLVRFGCIISSSVPDGFILYLFASMFLGSTRLRNIDTINTTATQFCANTV